MLHKMKAVHWKLKTLILWPDGLHIRELLRSHIACLVVASHHEFTSTL